MSTRFACDDTETLVAYLYDEVDVQQRDDVARHLAGCARCRDEVAALSGVRGALTAWAPPMPELRFTVVPETAASKVVRRQVPAWQTVPRWAQLVAATLALAVGAAVANVQVRHDAQGWTVSTGWKAPAPSAAPAPSDDGWRQAFAEFQSTVQRELAARPAVAPAEPAPSEAAVLQRVVALIEASEKRQTQELARQVTQVTADFDLQRQADLVRINQGLTRLDTRTTSDLAQQRELLNVLVRTGLRPPQ